MRPAVKNLPQGISRLNLGQTKWQNEMVQNFIVALMLFSAARCGNPQCMNFW